jgi:hypothetical protein
MKQLTALTVLGLGLLFALLASRLPDAANPASPGRVETAHSGTYDSRVENERPRAKESPESRTGGFWFW